MENIEELNKKIAEWLEIRKHDMKSQPNSNGGDFCQYCGDAYFSNPTRCCLAPVPNFTTSLDACFEYIVPKLAEGGHFLGMIMATPNEKLKYRCVVDLVEGDSEGVEAEAETPALALCRAVEKLIDG